MSGTGYVAPAARGRPLRRARATSTTMPTPRVRAADHRENLARAESMLPGFTDGLRSRGARRAGPAFAPPCPTACRSSAPTAEEGSYAATGLGSRGLLWAPLGAELLACAAGRRAAAAARATWPAPSRRGASSPDRMRPDLASLALFIRIAETSSITKAAARLPHRARRREPAHRAARGPVRRAAPASHRPRRGAHPGGRRRCSSTRASCWAGGRDARRALRLHEGRARGWCACRPTPRPSRSTCPRTSPPSPRRTRRSRSPLEEERSGAIVRGAPGGRAPTSAS